jgi:hypothetical protein
MQIFSGKPTWGYQLRFGLFAISPNDFLLIAKAVSANFCAGSLPAISCKFRACRRRKGENRRRPRWSRQQRTPDAADRSARARALAARPDSRAGHKFWRGDCRRAGPWSRFHKTRRRRRANDRSSSLVPPNCGHPAQLFTLSSIRPQVSAGAQSTGLPVKASTARRGPAGGGRP